MAQQELNAIPLRKAKATTKEPLHDLSDVSDHRH